MGNKSTVFSEIKSIKIDNNTNIDFATPKIMGILNITPDSFYDGGNYSKLDSLIEKTELMLEAGADIIDIGAVSTRPRAKKVSIDEELRRIIEPIGLLKKNFPDAIFSIDTYRSRVAKEAVEVGAHIINDISGGTMDSNMFKTIASLKVPYILMHIQGTPQTMQDSPIASEVINRVKEFFISQLKKLSSMGVSEVILDPGFGFGKTLESNYQLLKGMEETRISLLPILTGISRKSMINKVLRTTPEEALNGTTSLNTMALLSGANILRVHDVAEAAECIKLVQQFQIA